MESRKYFVGGNWKCNGTTVSVDDLVKKVLNTMAYNKDRVGKIFILIRNRDFGGSY